VSVINSIVLGELLVASLIHTDQLGERFRMVPSLQVRREEISVKMGEWIMDLGHLERPSGPNSDFEALQHITQN